MKINIAFVIPSLDIGGSELKVIDLVSGLNRELFNPIIITITNKGALVNKALELNVPVFCVNKKNKFDIFVIKRISKILKENFIEIVHVFTSTGKLWGRLGATYAKTEVIVSTEESLFRNTFMDRFLERRLIKKTNLIITNSKATMESALQATKINKEKYKVIHNGLPLDLFYNAKNLNLLEREDNEQIIMSVARLEERKRLDLLIGAFNLIKDEVNAKLIIVGGGQLEESLREYVIKLNLEKRVILLGSRNDVPNLLQEADVFVLPSIEEGFGNVIIEAMASKVAVVASNVGGIPEIIDDQKTGLLFEKEDLDGLKQALLLVLTNHELRKNLVLEAFNKVQYFSLERMIEEHERTYMDLLGRRDEL